MRRCHNPAEPLSLITDIFVIIVIVIVIEQYLLFNSLTFFYGNCFFTVTVLLGSPDKDQVIQGGTKKCNGQDKAGELN